MGSARAGDEEADGPAGAVHGQVIPRRRFTGWAAWYGFVYLVVPVVVLGALIDALLYLVFTAVFGRCYALFCLFG